MRPPNPPHFDCGTSGPLGPGAGCEDDLELGAGGSEGIPFCNWSRTPPPLVGCPEGAAGASWLGGAPVLMIDAGWRWKLASHDKARLVAKKPAAKSAVVRDKTLAVPRLDKKPLVDALIDRLQHHCITIRIDGPSLRSPDPAAPPPVSPKRRTTPA